MKYYLIIAKNNESHVTLPLNGLQYKIAVRTIT